MTEANETPQSSETPRLSPDEGRQKILANKRIAEEQFIPSPIIERLLWQVCGAWETVIEEVRFFQYVVAETPPVKPPFIHPDGGTVAQDMRRIARELNLRLPRDTIWTDECKAAKAIRDDLGHMLRFNSIEGVTPDQVVTLLRVAYREPDEMTTDGQWARHNHKTVTITEAQASEVLAGLEKVHKDIFSLRKFGMDFASWPDDKRVDEVAGLLPWWLTDWGPQPGEEGWAYPTIRQLRIEPQADYTASLPEDMRPEPYRGP